MIIYPAPTDNLWITSTPPELLNKITDGSNKAPQGQESSMGAINRNWEKEQEKRGKTGLRSKLLLPFTPDGYNAHDAEQVFLQTLD